MVQYTIYRTEEYTDWFEGETQKSKLQIKDRLLRIENEGHFGHKKDLKKNLQELKFNDGRRVYYTIIPETSMLLLLGGNKNGQDKDIKKARNILKAIIESQA